MTKFQFRKLLKLLGVSQGMLAREAGITRTAVGNYYNGRRPVNNLLAWGLHLKQDNIDKDKQIAKLNQKVRTLTARTKKMTHSSR